MKRSSGAVSCELEVQLVVPGDVSIPLRVSMTYDPADPYAVHAVFRSSDEVSWVFARELLEAGIDHPAGEGDVRVWSITGGEGLPSIVYIELASPDGRALIEVPAGALAGFLAQTEAIVPSGTESSRLDIDETLEAILRAV
jgi:hypothetical protein